MAFGALDRSGPNANGFCENSEIILSRCVCVCVGVCILLYYTILYELYIIRTLRVLDFIILFRLNVCNEIILAYKTIALKIIYEQYYICCHFISD